MSSIEKGISYVSWLIFRGVINWYVFGPDHLYFKRVQVLSVKILNELFVGSHFERKVVDVHNFDDGALKGKLCKAKRTVG